MKIKNVVELFAFDGREFVEAVYMNLLNRMPDENGLLYYLGRLNQGYGKASVIAQIANSPEYKPHSEIVGLNRLLRNQKRANHWFWKFFVRHKPEKYCEMNLSYLSMLVGIAKQMQTIKQDYRHQIELMESIVNILNTQLELTRDNFKIISNESHRDNNELIDAGVVRQAYLAVLGREPESEEAVMYHSKCGSIEALIDTLLQSEEFKTKRAPHFCDSLGIENYQKDININHLVDTSHCEFKNGVKSKQMSPLERHYESYRQ